MVVTKICSRGIPDALTASPTTSSVPYDQQCGWENIERRYLWMRTIDFGRVDVSVSRLARYVSCRFDEKGCDNDLLVRQSKASSWHPSELFRHGEAPMIP